MKILVIHDKRGNISSYGVAGERSGGQISLQPGRGKQVSEVEVAELKEIGGESEEEHEKLQNVFKRSRLDVSGAKPKLVKK
jgi:hypothetical protein